MEYKEFSAAIKYNPAEVRFDGVVVGASAEVEFTGKSIAELERNFKDAVDKHLARCIAKHVDAYRKFSGTIIIRIDKDVHRDCYLQALGDGRSLNKFIETTLREKVARSKTR